MVFRRIMFTATLFGALALGALATAQDDAIATGLRQPRGIAYDAAGNLLIAEAGSGGDVVVAEGEFGPMMAGASARLSMVTAEGTQEVLIHNLASTGGGGESLGIQSVLPTEESYWLVFSENAPSQPFGHAVVEIDRDTYRVKNFIDLFTYEQENNADGTEEVYSNPNDINIGPDGTLYIVDTGANTLYTWTPDAGLQVFKSWSDNPVPTAVDVAANGDVWVGFLGTEIAPGAAHVEHLSATGELIETFEGMTAITDLLVTETGDVYVVQLIGGMEMVEGQDMPNMLPGSVGLLTADGLTAIAEGLSMPYGLAQAPDGTLVVSTNSVFAEPDSGAVVTVPLAE